MPQQLQPTGNDDPPPQYDFTDDQRRSMEDEDRPLPKGWVRDFDKSSGHHFYVDTIANPPRSIWCHPYEDAQFRDDHPEIFQRQTNAAPSATAGSSAQSHSHGLEKGHKTDQHEKKGFVEKIMDKAIGTKEEREANRKEREAREREAIQRYTVRRAELIRQQQQQQQQQRQAYGQGPLYRQGPQYGYGGGMYGPPGMAYNGRRGRGMGGGGMGMGMGMPLMGGLAGGMLLGSAMDGGFGGGGYGGDYGGGGGDFGGGDGGGGGD